MNLYLVGFMGAGKTTVGRRLAERLGVRFVDLDLEIERETGLTVREIFLQRGEPAFRQWEREALERAAVGEPAVVATGGGTFASSANAELMKKTGLTVWLHPTFATLAARIGFEGKEDRPLFRDETSALALYRERLAAYRSAELTIDIGPEETPEEITARILLRLPRPSY